MPPKSERLNKNDFALLPKRELIRGQFFDIGYLKSPKTKVACIVSKKTMKLAVNRNKIKRRIYNAFKETRPAQTITVLFYPKKEALYTPYSELRDKMIEIFAKL